MRRHGANAERRQLLVEETVHASMQRARGVLVFSGSDDLYDWTITLNNYKCIDGALVAPAHDDRDDPDEWFYLGGLDP